MTTVAGRKDISHAINRLGFKNFCEMNVRLNFMYVESSTDIAGQMSISALSFRIRFICVSYSKIESKLIDVSLQKL